MGKTVTIAIKVAIAEGVAGAFIDQLEKNKFKCPIGESNQWISVLNLG
jgi:hypothetical protein